MPQLIRIFFGISLNSLLTEQITQLMSLLKIQLPDKKIRWTSPKNFHITLQFHSQMNTNDILFLIKNVQNEIRSFKTFRIVLDKCEIFPSLKTPKVISLAVRSSMALEDLVTRISTALKKTGYSPDSKTFRGHLTLCRLHQSSSNVLLPTKNITHGLMSMLVTQFYLFQSLPCAQKSVYIPLARFNLI